MPLIAVDGATWSGVCTSHSSPLAVTGTVVGNCTTVNGEGKTVCGHGAIVNATCGHSDTIIATGKNNATGKKIALLGDSTTGSPLIGTIVDTNQTTVNCA